MTIQDDRTTNLNLKKPYPTNLLADDVLRMRDALDAIDTAVHGKASTTSVQGLIDTGLAALVDSSPTALNTLNELAAAINDDASFATTVNNNIATKLALTGGTLSGGITFSSGDVTLSTDPTLALHAATKQFVETTVGAGPAQWATSNSAATLEINKRYLVDCSAASFTLTLPASPTAGQFVIVADAKGCFSTYPVTLAQNGTNIAGAALDLVLNVDRAVLTLIYSGDATTGWLVT